MNKYKQAFTLVELIVTILIITILGTIAFISLQGYGKQARDSTRISDISTIKSGLEVFNIDSGKYPKPTNGINITYSGGLVWTQGSVGESVITNISKIDRIPIDPLKQNEYTYSLLNNNKEYQIGTILEQGQTALNDNILNKTYAEDSVKTYVTGTYNGILAKTTINSNTYIIAIPCIISGDTSETTIEGSLAKKILACDGTTNAPATYTSYSHSGGFDYNSTSTGNILVYEGDLNSLSSNGNLQITLIKNLQTAYSGTSLINSDIAKILNIDTTTDTNGTKFLAQTLIQNSLDSSIKVDYNLLSQTSTSNTNIKVYAGNYHTCAITSVGGVKCWGSNSKGQLGDGTYVSKTTPVDVLTLTGGIVKLSLGDNHTCALTSSGGVLCWGEGSELGYGSQTNQTSPINVTGLTSGVIDITSNNFSSCAITSGGGVKCWGSNGFGVLGDGTTSPRYTPVDVTGLSSGYKKAYMGQTHACALSNAGGVKCWGQNTLGKLGDNTTTTSYTPVDVVGLSSGVKELALGYYNTCGLLDNGGVKCWGRIGLGGLINSKTPIDVTGLTSNVVSIGSGKDNICALIDTGGIKCFGYNYYGELGNGDGVQQPTPTDVIGLSNNTTYMSIGYNYGCVIEDGKIKCWGNNDNGQLGDGTSNLLNYLSPINTNLPSTTQKIGIGNNHGCKINNVGGVECWGFNGSAIGDGVVYKTQFNPSQVTGLASGVQSLAVGFDYNCALTNSGGVKCWGYNSYGLGNGSSSARTTPVDVYNLTSGVTKISAGNYHSCAILTDGSVTCWGRNDSGQLGNGNNTGTQYPVTVTGLSTGALDVSEGVLHTCAVLNTGGVQCWGNNSAGQLGDGTLNNSYTPVTVTGIPSSITSIQAGHTATCLLTGSGGVMCWGLNNYGQLGNGTTTNNSTPNYVTGLTTGVSKLSFSYYHGCAVMDNGSLKCWGYNGLGQLGDGTKTSKSTPVDINLGGETAIDVYTFYNNTCVKLTSGNIKCWGFNQYGVLQSGYDSLIKRIANIGG